MSFMFFFSILPFFFKMDSFQRRHLFCLRNIEASLKTGDEVPIFQNLKYSLQNLFNNITIQWKLTQAQKEEKAPTALERVRWTLIRTNLLTVITKMRNLQKDTERRCCHTSNPFQSIEIIFEKYNDLWKNYLQPNQVDIANDDRQWIDLWVAMSFLKESIYELNIKMEFEEI